MDTIIFYTIGCPACNVLEKKLDAKNIDYVKETDEKKMINMGLDTMPCLRVNGQILKYKEAIDWINSYEG